MNRTWDLLLYIGALLAGAWLLATVGRWIFG